MRIGEVDRHPGGWSQPDVSECVTSDRSLDVSAPHLIGHTAEAAQSTPCPETSYASPSGFQAARNAWDVGWPPLIGQHVLFLKWRLAVVCLRGGEPWRQVVNVHSIWCVAVKRSVRPGLVVERQVAFQPLLGCADGLVRVQIDLLVFDALPESFHEHVVPPAAGAVPADLNAVLVQEPRELQARELAALIGVEDIRCAIVGHSLLDRLRTETGRQRVGQPPRQHPATGPVHDCTQVHEAAVHRNVGNIGRPDMVRPGDLHVA